MRLVLPITLLHVITDFIPGTYPSITWFGPASRRPPEPVNVLKRPPESVLFDLDGTLVDTAGEFVAIVQAMRSERDLQPLDEHLIRRVVSNGANALVSLAFDSEVHPRS